MDNFRTGALRTREVRPSGQGARNREPGLQFRVNMPNGTAADIERAGASARGDDDIYTAPRTSHNFDPPLERELRQSIEDLEGNAPMLARMARFHLGWIETNGEPTAYDVRQSVQGKRIRPHLAFLSCAAVGGEPVRAAPLAAAIELLHNFTLIHDDIQDRSPNRRHRATVWRIWGDAQAINAGDALFALAQRALLRTDPVHVPSETLIQLLDAFNRMTIEIVRGQVLDLEFEGRANVTPSDYLAMIGGKTAAIVRYAAWAGAIVGGASEATAQGLGEFGEALGLGFQLRDDVLGIWGSDDETGKDQTDDIRRRKKSLPILMLLDRVQGEEAERLRERYRSDAIDETGVAEIRRLLETHGIHSDATAQVAHYHRIATESLDQVFGGRPESESAALLQMVARLDARRS